jgi:photosystem II stability/assembly factor-like uncharacterized protein
MYYILLLIIATNALHAQTHERGDLQSMQMRVTGTWREVGASNQAGRVVDVEYDHKTGRVWLAGSGGTIWSGDTTGTTWKCHTDAYVFTDPLMMKLIRMPNGVERLVVVSGQAGIWMLDIATNTWTPSIGIETRVSNLSKLKFFDAISITRNKRIEILAVGDEVPDQFGTMRKVLYRSIDSGLTFQHLRYIDTYRTIWTDGEREAWILFGNVFARIGEDGKLSDIGTTPLKDYISEWGLDKEFQRAAFAGADPGSVAFAVTRADSTRFYESTDVGITWNVVGTIPLPFNGRRSIAQAYEDGSYIFGGVEAYRSADDCRTWDKISDAQEYSINVVSKLHADITAVRSFPQEVTFICTGGGVYITRSGGRTVRNITLSNLQNGQYYSTYTPRNTQATVYAGSLDQGLQRSTRDEGVVRVFEQMVPGTSERVTSGDNGASLFFTTPNSMVFVPDAEKAAWEPVAHKLQRRYGIAVAPIAVRPSQPSKVFLGGEYMNSIIYTYAYNGTELIKDSLSFGFNGTITALQFAPSDDRIGYAATMQYPLFRTTDGGLTWGQFPMWAVGYNVTLGQGLAIDPRNPDRVAIGGTPRSLSDVCISLFQDGRIEIVDGLPACSIHSLAFSADGRYLAAATTVGAFIYDTALETLTNISAFGAPIQIYCSVEYAEHLGVFRFATLGRGIWDFTITGITSAPEQNISKSALTLSGELLSGTPSVRITSDRETDATIVWYDLAGRRYAQEDIRVLEGTWVRGVPEEARRHGARTCVITTADGTVAACLAP